MNTRQCTAFEVHSAVFRRRRQINLSFSAFVLSQKKGIVMVVMEKRQTLGCVMPHADFATGLLIRHLLGFYARREKRQLLFDSVVDKTTTCFLNVTILLATSSV